MTYTKRTLSAFGAGAAALALGFVAAAPASANSGTIQLNCGSYGSGTARATAVNANSFVLDQLSLSTAVPYDVAVTFNTTAGAYTSTAFAGPLDFDTFTGPNLPTTINSTSTLVIYTAPVVPNIVCTVPSTTNLTLTYP
jgi:hypothetical protein